MDLLWRNLRNHLSEELGSFHTPERIAGYVVLVFLAGPLEEGSDAPEVAVDGTGADWLGVGCVSQPVPPGLLT